MKIFADSHHQGLTQSLKLLFINRLGWELRFPKGMEWWHENLWEVFPHESTAQQYLERETEGVLGITLDEFKATKFDILLCSIPQHVPIWIKLRDLYQPQAKLIMQIGNAWAFDNNFPIKNILASAIIPKLNDFNVQQYHQEFDLNIFYPAPVTNSKKIYSFINCLNTEELYKKDWELFLELERMMPDWEFKSFGGQCRDGALAPIQVVADKMREATFIYQVKTNGDGYGHNIFGAAAVGRPIITRLSDYQGKLAESLIDPDSSVIIDGKTLPEIVANINGTDKYSWDDPDLRGRYMNGKFKKAVHFDREARDIAYFLDRLI